MHELGLASEVVAIATERATGRRVKRLVLEVGKLSAVLPDALRFCFEVAAESTLLEGAALTIVEVPGLGRCRACKRETTFDRPYGKCACGGFEFEWLSGDELTIRELELH